MAGNWKGNFQLQHPFHAQLNRAYNSLMKNRCFESHFILPVVDDHINVTLNEKEPGHFFLEERQYCIHFISIIID